MGLTPLFDRVIIAPVEVKGESEEGILIPDVAQEKPTEGTVVAVGPAVECVEVGETVLYSKFAGTEFQDGDEALVIMADTDIIAIRD